MCRFNICFSYYHFEQRRFIDRNGSYMLGFLVLFHKNSEDRSTQNRTVRETHRPQERCGCQRFCPVSSPQHTRTAPCCCHDHPLSLSGQAGSRTESRRHFLAPSLSCRGTPVALPAGCPRFFVLHVQLTVEPSGTQEDGVHVLLGLVGGSVQ